ncbi:hypothetical protein [Candidatus Amarobacter glycogenicus]|uniref:hypothetical protein n=1 Tax=Candidatus Amarobacter glycogenicus TaxID=3140699 RepID=UPI0031CCC40D
MKQASKIFGLLDGGGTDQDRPACGVHLLDFANDRIELHALVDVDASPVVLADHRAVVGMTTTSRL